jgi:hypothetical protein
MSAGRQIVCGHCGQINRLPAERTPAAARCGSRHKPIFDGHPIEIDEQGFSRHVARSDILYWWTLGAVARSLMAPMFERATRELEPNVRPLKLKPTTRQQSRRAFRSRESQLLCAMEGRFHAGRARWTPEPSLHGRWMDLPTLEIIKPQKRSFS